MTHTHSIPKKESHSSEDSQRKAEGNGSSCGAEVPASSEDGAASRRQAAEETVDLAVGEPGGEGGGHGGEEEGECKPECQGEGESRGGHTGIGPVASSSHLPSEEPLPATGAERDESGVEEGQPSERGVGDSSPLAAVHKASPSAPGREPSPGVSVDAFAAASAPPPEAFVPPPHAPPPYTVTEQPLPATAPPSHPREPPPPYYARSAPEPGPRAARVGNYAQSVHTTHTHDSCVRCEERDQRGQQDSCTDQDVMCCCLLCYCCLSICDIAVSS